MAKKRKKGRGPHRKKKRKGHSALEDHERRGKSLIPPFRKYENLQLQSWPNDRLPELLWAVLLVSHMPQSTALSVFRGMVNRAAKRFGEEVLADLTHSGLARLEPDILDGLLEELAPDPITRRILRPLLLLEALPARDHWRRAIGSVPTEEDWGGLMEGVAKTLFHQTQEATDCRYFRVMGALFGGRIQGIGDREHAKELLYYPSYGDQRGVRPFIRTIEGAISINDAGRDVWPVKFWRQCMTDAPCWPIQDGTSQPTPVAATTADRTREVLDLLAQHCNATRGTTAIDPKHDTVFGVALYSIAVLQELLRVGASASIGGRVLLRTIAEAYLSLAYLVKKDSTELWTSYRVYGAGQAKLAYLKLEDSQNKPHFVTAEALKELANEDMWEEYVGIDLGHWEQSNLRAMSEEAGVKSEYDTYYAWTSTYAHAHWGAIRDSVFDTCGNPLHRLHRIPRSECRTLPDVVPDACRLVDLILGLVSSCYPEFGARLQS